MKFWVDNNLSRKLSNLINELGYDSEHVGELNLHASTDENIFKVAYEENRIIISADTDFGYLLSKWGKRHPSLILFRNYS
ncbi:MAG: DUF5615 family PIN-like protein [Candidatus Hydrogenedentota bacterium]